MFYGIRVTKEQFIVLKKLEKKVDPTLLVRMLVDGFDFGTAPILKPNEEEGFDIVQAHWEFIPPWVKSMEEMKQIRKGIDPKTGARKPYIPWMNAKGETLLSSKMFRDAALKRRCLILCSHFFEWKHIGKQRFPHHISLKGKDYFFIAGIWQPWTDKETGEMMDTFALITTEANPFMAEIHNSKKRMPTILPDEEAWEWMFDDLTEERITQLATYQIPSEWMQAYTIRKDFKTVENPLEPYQYAELTDLFS